MKNLKTFKIVLEDGKRPRFPSEILHGHVYLELANEMKLRSLRVYFYGQSRVIWRKGTRKKIQNEEEFIQQNCTVHGKEEGSSGPNPVLSPGEHLFPFSFQIPHRNIPSSFVGVHGYVRYWLKAVISRPWRFDHSTKTALTILEVVDVNKEDFLKPIHLEDEIFTGCCCRSGPLSITVRTDRSAYCPGEAVALNAAIVNSLSRSSGKIKIKLVQTSVFRSSHGETKTHKAVVHFMKKDKVPAHDSQHWNNLLFFIPSVVPTMSASRCIKVSYTLEIVVGKVILYSPLIIGSIPFHQPPDPSAPPLRDEMSPLPSAPAPDYGAMASTSHLEMPPSYMESVQGGATIRDSLDGQHMMGDTSFTPMYPFVPNYRFVELPEYSVLPPRRRGASQDSNASSDSMEPTEEYRNIGMN